MMQEPKVANIQISPLAILAAVLFNADSYEKVKTKADDSDVEIEVEVPTVQIEREPNGIACCIPLNKILHYVKNNYEMQFKVVAPEGALDNNDSIAVIIFEKAAKHSVLLGANGQAVRSESPMFSRIMDRVK